MCYLLKTARVLREKGLAGVICNACHVGEKEGDLSKARVLLCLACVWLLDWIPFQPGCNGHNEQTALNICKFSKCDSSFAL